MWTIVINAGGESRRMGENKALKLFRGEALVARMVRRLQPGADELLVTVRKADDLPDLGVRLVPDQLPGRGALGGLWTALAASSHPIAAVLACDMPFIDPALLEIQRILMEQEEADVVIPCTPKGMEPLHALYRPAACLAPVRRCLDEGQMRILDFFPFVKVRVMPAGEVARYDPLFRSFINVNTPEEFYRAEALAAEVD
jgi:molybdopterin-guanine dinucleotide biosynthesis protein A